MSEKTEKDVAAIALVELLAAEATYLRNRGWLPFAIGERAPVKILWKRSLFLKEQDEALAMQKEEDRKLVGR